MRADRQSEKELLPRAAAAALLLFSVYWVTASGRFHSIDEQAVFAVARNLVYHGRVDESTLYWAAPYDTQAHVGLDGELYSKYGIGHSLVVAGLIAVARAVPGAGLVSSSTLIGALATALAAFFLALCAGRLGYSTRVSIVAELLFGLATFAWVYAKTMFGEPLVALGWIVILWLALGGFTWRRALLAGLVMAATVSVRPALILVAIPLSLLLWQGELKESLRRLVAFFFPVGAVAIGLLALNWMRFGDPLQFGYSETFNGSLVQGLGGFLFSPDRSLFIFAPPLLGLLWSAPGFIRRHGALGWKLLITGIFVLVLHSLWPVFWGGPVWGPRYLLVILPLLVVLLLPAIDLALEKRHWSGLGLGILAVAGLAMQLRGVVWDSLAAVQTLGQRYPLWLLRPQAAELDIAWLRAGWGWMLAAVAIAVLALATLRWPRRWLLGTTCLAAVLGSGLLLNRLGQAGFGYQGQSAYAAAVAQLKDQARPGDALVLNPAPYQEPLDELVWFLDEPGATVPFYGVLRPAPAESAASAGRIDRLLGEYRRVWLLTEGLQPGDPASTTERQLSEAAALVGTSWLDDGYRLTLFEAAEPSSMGGAVDESVGDCAMLESWEGAWREANPVSLQLTLHWRALCPTATPLHLFAQILDAQGPLVAGWDGVPGGSFSPSTAWQAGEGVTDRIALELPAGAGPEPFRLIVGLYDSTTGERLLTAGGADSVPLTAVP